MGDCQSYILGLFWGYIGIMEKKMEAIGIIGIIGYILGLYWGNGKENGNYCNILGVYICIYTNGWLSKFLVPFWIPIIIRHLILRVPKKGP